MQNESLSDKDHRVGIVAILIDDPESAHTALNDILHDYAHIIIGRLGLPYRERSLSIIALIIDGNTDDVGGMTGKLGQLPHVTVKSAFAKNK
jgi:putative iron-only hydrogenase system regulator